ALLDNGKLEDALEIALRAVSLSPDSDIAHLALCRAYYLNGAKTKAVEEYRLALVLNEKITFTVNRSSRYSFILEDEVFREDKPEEK
ncbi:MAG TPA: tetratricopeptide repeat protein, partial [Patescibacteria group bacterium]|nr:tetratricopeptide repeat protein [Patescibacteria group bacterium]